MKTLSFARLGRSLGSRGPHALLALCLGGFAALACGTGQIGGAGTSSVGASAGASVGASAGAGGSVGTSAGGSVGVSAGASSGAGAAVAVSGPRPPLCSANQTGKPAYQMLRRLSQSEYNHTLIDVFGADPTTWEDIQFVGEITQAGAYDTYSDALTVTQPLIASLVDATFDRAQSLLTGPAASTLLVTPCTAASLDATCAEAMVRAYAYRLFRRPVADTEVADYVGLFTQGVSTLGMAPSDALAGTLAALMQSPNTLYIQELGQPQGTSIVLGPYELASILSYGLTGTAPSKALLDSAAAGALSTPQGVATAAQAMIQSPAGQAHVSNFFRAWLAYDGVPYAVKDPTVYTLPNSIATAMVQETQLFVDGTYQNGGALSDLLLSPQTYVNLPLAQYYGWSTNGLTVAQFAAQARPAGQGLGILTQGSFLARLAAPNSSSPTQRGVFILRSLLCMNVPNPPANVPVIPVPTGMVTTRQRYEMQHAVGSCQACHGRIDPIGFGLENFDGAGVYRTQEIGQPIDASGTILDLGGVTFNGPAQLAQTLVAAPELHQCLAAQMTAYVLGVSVSDGLCIAPAAAYASTTPTLKLSDVLSQVVEPTHLTLRSPPATP